MGGTRPARDGRRGPADSVGLIRGSRRGATEAAGDRPVRTTCRACRPRTTPYVRRCGPTSTGCARSRFAVSPGSLSARSRRAAIWHRCFDALHRPAVALTLEDRRRGPLRPACAGFACVVLPRHRPPVRQANDLSRGRGGRQEVECGTCEVQLFVGFVRPTRRVSEWVVDERGARWEDRCCDRPRGRQRRCRETDGFEMARDQPN